MATTKLVTAEELEQREDDGNRYDLIRGELICMAPSARRPSRIALKIGVRLLDYVESRRLGEVYGADAGFILARNPDVVLSPDAAFVGAERLHGVDEDHFLALAPDLAVEVISPSDRAGHISDKVIEYLDAGTRLLWLVEPRRQIVTVYTPDRTARLPGVQDTLDGGDVLPGFRLPIAEIFS